MESEPHEAVEDSIFRAPKIFLGPEDEIRTRKEAQERRVVEEEVSGLLEEHVEHLPGILPRYVHGMTPMIRPHHKQVVSRMHGCPYCVRLGFLQLTSGMGFTFSHLFSEVSNHQVA